MTTDLTNFEGRFIGNEDVSFTFQSWTLFRDKSRVECTGTCDHSTTYRLSIHNEEHHLREDRPDNEASDEEPVGEMMTATTM